jgi:hypothetical protein
MKAAYRIQVVRPDQLTNESAPVLVSIGTPPQGLMILELIKYISIFNFEQIIYGQNPSTYLMHRPTSISLVGILASYIHLTA